MFQIAVEVEGPGNIWGLLSPPVDWGHVAPSVAAPEAAGRAAEEKDSGRVRTEKSSRAEHQKPGKNRIETETPQVNPTDKNLEAKSGEGAAAPSAEAFGFAGTVVPEAAEAGSMDSPLVRELRAQIESQANKAAEGAIAQAGETLKHTAETVEREHLAAAESFFLQWREDLDRDRDAARDEVTRQAAEQMAHVGDEIAARVTGQMSWVREELRSDLKQEFGSYMDQMRALVTNLERGAEAVRKETEAATASGDRLAQIKIALDAAEAAVDQRMRRLKDAAQETVALDDLSKAWRHKLGEQMDEARGEWSELLQTSLDGAAQRLASRLAESSQSELQSAEVRLSERVAQLSQPVTNAVSDAQQALSGVRTALDAELQRARTSLADIENAADRMREFSGQIDAASHDALNQLHRRLDAAVQSQVNELRRHAGALTAELPLRIQPALDAAGQELVSKTLAELDTRLVPHLERVPELVRELTAHEVQAEESLRMYRERLRQAAESSRRDAAAQMSATASELRSEFENARTEALGRWNEELEASAGRTTQAAIDSLAQNVEWHQKKAQEYVETLTQESLAKTDGVFEARTQEAIERLGEKLGERNATHIEEAKLQLQGVSSEVIGRTMNHLDAVSTSAANALAERMEQVSGAATRKFNEANDALLAERTSQIDVAANSIRMSFEQSAGALLEKYRTEMAAFSEEKYSEVREFHSRELAASLQAAQIERDAQAREWFERLARANEESLQKFEDQLHGTSELWVNVAVEKLAENGQAALASLSRAGEQALRSSLLNVLEQIAETVRQSIDVQPAGSAATPPRPTLVNPASGQRENRAGA